jgi:hypothetical protein
MDDLAPETELDPKHLEELKERVRRMGYGEAEVFDGTGRLLARATATFIVLPAPGAF